VPFGPTIGAERPFRPGYRWGHRFGIMPNTGRPEIDGPITVPLLVSHRVQVNLARALDELTNLDWLGPAVTDPLERDGVRRTRAVLDLPVFDGSAPSPIRKAALIDVGTPHAQGRAVVLDIGWQSDSMTPLFPVFAGQLRVTSTSLVLSGRYAPPFGRLGLLVDVRILHFVAQRTAQAFLARVAARIEG
jgi:hypothetical protein